MDFVYNVVQLIQFSPKRLSLFDSFRKDVALNSGETPTSLRMLCPTRWTVQHASIDSIVQNYQVLQAALGEIVLGHDQYAAKANGLLTRMEKFDTFFRFETCLFSFLFC